MSEPVGADEPTSSDTLLNEADNTDEPTGSGTLFDDFTYNSKDPENSAGIVVTPKE